LARKKDTNRKRNSKKNQKQRKKMKAVNSRITGVINVGCMVEPCDNSGAKQVRIFAVRRSKTTKGRIPAAGVGDLVLCSVRKGKPEMRKQVVQAVVVRQKKPFRRPDGTRIRFEDNSVVVVKDDQGNPKGTLIKGPVPKEVCDRWPPIAKLARIVV
jgi:large subunit ribosomal protein L14